jgi:hypothetical protein
MVKASCVRGLQFIDGGIDTEGFSKEQCATACMFTAIGFLADAISRINTDLQNDRD